jgi:DNA polymerase-3 subunit epsilon
MAAAEERAAAVFILPRDLVFVDLETTGGNAAFHRITEVGIVRMQDDRVVEEWSSLVNPECRIPAYIEAFTGITNDMVAGAPRFSDLAALVLTKLRSPTRESPIFVAHNARFDYSFLRTEFRRLDVHFSAKVLCTVKLSRRLFPEYPRHSLDAVMERHRLTCAARHRALGDARVLGDFWSKLRSEISEEKLAAAAHLVIGANRLPSHLPAGLADELPEGPGVYRLFGEGDVLLYIGRSHSLRTRILGHFATENSDPKQQKKAQQTRRIDWMETAGDLGAQLKEAEWIKMQKPLFNKRLKPKSAGFTLQASEHGHGVGRPQGARRHRARPFFVPEGLGSRDCRWWGLVRRLPGRKVQGRLRRQGTARIARHTLEDGSGRAEIEALAVSRTRGDRGGPRRTPRARSLGIPGYRPFRG